MTTRLELQQRIYRALGDPASAQFDVLFIQDGIYAALDAILDWYAKSKTSQVTGDGTLTAFTLPSDLYRIVSVFDSESGLFLPSSSMSALRSPGDNIEANQDWAEWPEGYITFSNPITVDETATIYYGALWTKPATDQAVLETPTWLDKALTYYACSYALLQKATQAAQIRQWNVQVDSGSPEMNPIRDMSSYFLERFEIEMKRVPARMRGVRG